MKKVLSLFSSVLLSAILFQSCTEEKTTFDKALLYGKWKSGTLYDIYESNGKGKTWDEKDDVSEAEAQPFTWTLTADNLLQIHIMETGGIPIPRPLTVKELTSTSLRYTDAGRSYSFTKVN